MNILLKTVLVGLLFLSANIHANQIISKSVFAQLADTKTFKFIENEFTYFPAGTRLVDGHKSIEYRGSQRDLVFSEDGVAAYIKKGFYWTPDQVEYLRKTGGDEWIFITRPLDVIANISDKVKLVIGLSRGEKFPLITQNEDSFTIKVGQNKIPKLGDMIKYQVTVPRKNGNYVNFRHDLERQKLQFYTLSIYDGISGIKKPCNTNTVIGKKYKTNAKATMGFSLKSFWVNITAQGEIDYSTEINKLETFSKDSNVSRQYYTRNNELYKLTKEKSCEGNKVIKYIYTNQNINEVSISGIWGKKSNLAVDNRTNQILISCPKQYFEFKDELEGMDDFSPYEIEFIISHTAKFKNLTSSECTK